MISILNEIFKRAKFEFEQHDGITTHTQKGWC